MTTDIESRELKRVVNMEEGLPPEHQRTSTTDDVECLFSMMRDFVGNTLPSSKYSMNFGRFA